MNATAAPPVQLAALPRGGILAEAVTFDPELVVAVFVVLLLLCLGVCALVVTGIVAGVRAGVDPDRTRAEGAWRFCLLVEGFVAVPALLSGDLRWMAAAVAVVAATYAARSLGRLRWRGDPLDGPRDIGGHDPWVR